MDLQYPPLLPLLTSVLLLILLILIKRLARSKSEGNTRLPPGPQKLPIVGNIHQLSGGILHRLLCDLACKHGPDLMHLKLGQIDHVTVSSAEAAREIMKTHDLNFSSRPSLLVTTIMFYNNTDVGFAPYGSYWRQLRKICVLELLSTRRVKASFALRQEEVLNLVRDISAFCDPTVNLTEKITSLANTIISKQAFGATCVNGERFISATKKLIKFGSGFNLVDLYPSLRFMDALTRVSSRVRSLHREVDVILEQIIEEHCTKRGAKATGREVEKLEEDLVDVLLSIKEKSDLEFPLTLTNIKAVIFDMFAGGSETASTTLEWAMAELIRHPEVMKKVQSEIRQILKGKEKIEEEDLMSLHYLKLVIREILRLHPLLPLLLPRLCTESCTVMGYSIPAGSRAVINAWAIGRDPRYWEDGESFRPERFGGSPVDFAGGNFEYIPFGGGRRICPGLNLGMAIVELVLALLLSYFDWELPAAMKPEDLDMTELVGSTSGRKPNLLLGCQTSKFICAYVLAFVVCNDKQYCRLLQAYNNCASQNRRIGLLNASMKCLLGSLNPQNKEYEMF